MALGGDSIDRVKKTFSPQKGLTAAQQGRHADFANSPFDRGHMTPANDAPDMATQRDTFVVTNIVPQVSDLNEHLWARLEASVHEIAEQDDEVYVVTGPGFDAFPQLLAGRIAIPTTTWKAIYIPTTGVVIAFVATNQADTTCTIVTIAELTAMTGIDPFPSLLALVKAKRPDFTLPAGMQVRAGQRTPLPLPDCH